MIRHHLKMFAVNDFLMLPSMKHSSVAAGKNGLDQPISMIQAIDAPLPAAQLRPKEFLVYRNAAPEAFIEKFERWVPIYKKHEVRGLALYSKFTIPDSLKSICDQYAFPLIRLSAGSSLADLMRESLDAIVEAEEDLFEYTQQVLENLVSQLSRNTPMPAVLRDVELATGYKMILMHHSEIISTESIIADEPKFLRENREALQICGLQDLIINDIRVTSYISSYDSARSMRMICLGSSMPYYDAVIYMLNKICQIIGTGLKNVQVIREMTSLYQDRFLRDWLTGNFKNRNELLSGARSYGVDITNDSQCLVVIVDSASPDHSIPFESLDILKLRRSLAPIYPYIYAVLMEKLTLILRCPSSEPSVDQLLLQVQKRLNYFLHQEVCLYISGEASIDDVPRLREEARQVCRIARRIRVDRSCVRYPDLGIYSLLARLIDDPITDQYCDHFLAPIQQYDREHGSRLLKTLRTYYDNDSNARQTANVTFTHYNTILYRLSRIREILDADIDDPEVKLQIQIALRLQQLKDDAPAEPGRQTSFLS